MDAGSGTVKTEFASYKADLANIIPPQRAGQTPTGAWQSMSYRWVLGN